MKRFMRWLFCMGSIVSMASGQITISESAFTAMFAPGTPIRFFGDTSSAIVKVNVGHKGGPQTFDFSSYSFVEFSTDTIKYVSAYPVLSARFSPTAITFKIANEGQVYEQPILALQSGTMTQTGHMKFYTADSFQVRHETPGRVFLKFPMALGDSLRTTSTDAETTYTNGSPFNINSSSGSDDLVVDAWGTLLLPGGKSYSCLRLRDTEVLPWNGKEFRFVTQNGGMLFVSSYNTEPDTGLVTIQDGLQYVINPSITSVDRSPIIPSSMALKQNYPNPFNPETAISFQLSAISDVKLTVYDILGRAVATLVDGRLPAGNHRATWNATGFPSGIYFARMQAGTFVQTMRMTLVK